MASLKDDLDELRNEVKENKDEIRNLRIENGNLKQVINFNIPQLDDLQQYSRRQNIKIYGIPESQFKVDDGEKVIMKIAKELKIELEDTDTQRAHRLEKERSLQRK